MSISLCSLVRYLPEHSTPVFENFLNMLGTKVTVAEFNGYKAGLKHGTYGTLSTLSIVSFVLLINVFQIASPFLVSEVNN